MLSRHSSAVLSEIEVCVIAMASIRSIFLEEKNCYTLGCCSVVAPSREWASKEYMACCDYLAAVCHRYILSSMNFYTC